MMAQLSNNKVFFLFIFYQTQNSFQYAANIRTVILLNFALTKWNAISMSSARSLHASFFHYNVSGALYKVKLDHVREAGARRRRDICHGEELNPVLTEAT